MPKFGKAEKARIDALLLQEGERLFAAHGLQKVTIDALCAAVHIAKASFYAFYESKEALYLAIVQRAQQEIFASVEEVLLQNTHLTGKERAKQAFAALYDRMQDYPILANLDAETAERVTRKVSASSLSAFSEQNRLAAETMQRHGVRFSCSAEIASCVFQLLYQSWLQADRFAADVRDEAMALWLDGMIDRIVLD
ncbi:MAG: TetR/AcrR family transcriptional regulator [Hominenteromicrobium sp.]